MSQTPAHDGWNPDLLPFLPKSAQCIVEVGCGGGGLASAYRQADGTAHYIGIELIEPYAARAKAHCSDVIIADVEELAFESHPELFTADCWVFGDSLEHLRDPWGLLARVRSILPPSGCVVACIPNAQHWSVQAQLSVGAFHYRDSGLFDRSHLRWFTRETIVALFEGAGFAIVDGRSRIFDEPEKERVLPHLRALAAAVGADPDQAVRDALPLQYVVRALPSMGVPRAPDAQ